MIDVLGTKTYKPQEAAKILGIGKNNIYTLINNGDIDHTFIAGHPRITEHHIKSYLAKNEIKAEKPRLYSKAV